MDSKTDQALTPQEHFAEVFAQLLDRDIEQFYTQYQLWVLRHRLPILEQQLEALLAHVAENRQLIHALRPSAIAQAVLARLQSKGVESVDLLDRLLDQGEDWLDRMMQRLDYCEQVEDFIQGDYTQWCLNSLEGAYDWIDSVRVSSRGDAASLQDEEGVPAAEFLPLVTEEMVLRRLKTDDGEPLPLPDAEEDQATIIAASLDVATYSTADIPQGMDIDAPPADPIIWENVLEEEEQEISLPTLELSDLPGFDQPGTTNDWVMLLRADTIVRQQTNEVEAAASGPVTITSDEARTELIEQTEMSQQALPSSGVPSEAELVSELFTDTTESAEARTDAVPPDTLISTAENEIDERETLHPVESPAEAAEEVATTVASSAEAAAEVAAPLADDATLILSRSDLETAGPVSLNDEDTTFIPSRPDLASADSSPLAVDAEIIDDNKSINEEREIPAHATEVSTPIDKTPGESAEEPEFSAVDENSEMQNQMALEDESATPTNHQVNIAASEQNLPEELGEQSASAEAHMAEEEASIASSLLEVEEEGQPAWYEYLEMEKMNSTPRGEIEQLLQNSTDQFTSAMSQLPVTSASDSSESTDPSPLAEPQISTVIQIEIDHSETEQSEIASTVLAEANLDDDKTLPFALKDIVQTIGQKTQTVEENMLEIEASESSAEFVDMPETLDVPAAVSSIPNQPVAIIMTPREPVTGRNPEPQPKVVKTSDAENAPRKLTFWQRLFRRRRR